MTDGRKYRTVSVRFTEEDFAQLSRSCERYGMRSISEYIRFLVLDEDARMEGGTRQDERRLIEKLGFNVERMLLLMEIGQQTLLEATEVIYRRTTDNSSLPKDEKLELLRRSQKAVEAIKTSAVDKVRAFHEGDDDVEDPFMEELYLNMDDDDMEAFPVEE